MTFKAQAITLLGSSHVCGWNQVQEPSLFLSLSYTKLGLVKGPSHQESLSCQRDGEEDGIISSWGSSRVSES